MEILFLVLAFLLGALIAWLLSINILQKKYLSRAEIQANYIPKALYEGLENNSDIIKEDLREKEQEIRALGQNLASKEQQLWHQGEKLDLQKVEIKELHQKLNQEFEQIATKLLEEKSQLFSTQNRQQISNMLDPLKEKIQAFETNIEQKFYRESTERISLKQELKNLQALNTQLSQDANNLVSALRGDNKKQGDWGEFRLELLLEKAGLEEGIQYSKQNSFKSENGKQLRPDFIIHLPEDKHLIIDSKVSLLAYEKYFNSDDKLKKEQKLKSHIDSIRNHYKGLSAKNYQNLYQINSPDYVLMYIPIEPAYSLALQNDQKLFLEALDKNVVIVTSSTLLATMRTVSFIWKQEKQKRSVQEIARQSGLLYDKFCNFVGDLHQIGHQLDSAQKSYHAALNKLSDSSKKGDTLIGRAEKIKSLGAKTTKSLPDSLLG